MTEHTDVVVGGGQAGLAADYHLRRQGLDFVILDAGTALGGSWQHMWDSLHLFSPAEHSSLSTSEAEVPAVLRGHQQKLVRQRPSFTQIWARPG